VYIYVTASVWLIYYLNYRIPVDNQKRRICLRQVYITILLQIMVKMFCKIIYLKRWCNTTVSLYNV